MEKKMKFGLLLLFCSAVLITFLIINGNNRSTSEDYNISTREYPPINNQMITFFSPRGLNPHFTLYYPKKVMRTQIFQIKLDWYGNGITTSNLLVNLSSDYFILDQPLIKKKELYEYEQGGRYFLVTAPNISIASAPIIIRINSNRVSIEEELHIEITEEDYKSCTLDNNCACLSKGRSLKGHCFYINTSSKRIGPKRSNCSCFDPVEISGIKLDFVEGNIISDNELNITIKNTGNYTLVDVHIGICTDGGAATYSIDPPKVTLKPGDIQSYQISGCSISDRDNRIIILRALEETYSASVNFSDLIIQ